MAATGLITEDNFGDGNFVIISLTAEHCWTRLRANSPTLISRDYLYGFAIKSKIEHRAFNLFTPASLMKETPQIPQPKSLLTETRQSSKETWAQLVTAKRFLQ